MNYCLSTIFESMHMHMHMHMPEYDNNIESDKEFHHAVNVYSIVNCYCSNNCLFFFLASLFALGQHFKERPEWREALASIHQSTKVPCNGDMTVDTLTN